MPNNYDGPVTVTKLTQYIKNLFAADSQLNSLRVSGEISNFKHHSSGHMYFTLKDANASLRCVMFRSCNARLTFRPSQGMNVVVGGRLSIYERDGQYQMYAETMLPEGVGSLFAAFEALKKRLATEGLFATERKRPLPKLPARIGVVTSPTGAAIRDILTTLSRRFPQAEVLVIPVLVQGPDASGQIAEAIGYLNKIDDVDVMIIGRGGGAIEELWAFNEEVVARAIAASEIPVVSAVGHETDFTIADFVADARAATPTAAAEIVVPDQREILQFLEGSKQRMAAKLAAKLEHDKRYLERLACSRVLMRPLERLEQYSQGLDQQSVRLENRMKYLLQGFQSQVKGLEGKLSALSPEAVLGRGFAICLDEKGNVVRNASLLAPNDRLKLRLQYGHVTTRVEETDTEEKI